MILYRSKEKGLVIGMNWLKNSSYIGYEHSYYDGNHWGIGFVFFEIWWSDSAYLYLTTEELNQAKREFLERNK